MPLNSWDLVMPDGTALIANAGSRRSAIARALAKEEFPGEVARAFQDADDTTAAGESLRVQGWLLVNDPLGTARRPA